MCKPHPQLSSMILEKRTNLKTCKEAWWVELTTTICIVREPRWSHEAYIGLDFLPREDKFPTNI